MCLVGAEASQMIREPLYSLAVLKGLKCAG